MRNKSVKLGSRADIAMRHSFATTRSETDKRTLAFALFAKLGWATVSAPERLNPAPPTEAVTAAVGELARDRLSPRRLSGRMVLG